MRGDSSQTEVRAERCQSGYSAKEERRYSCLSSALGGMESRNRVWSLLECLGFFFHFFFILEMDADAREAAPGRDTESTKKLVCQRA